MRLQLQCANVCVCVGGGGGGEIVEAGDVFVFV